METLAISIEEKFDTLNSSNDWVSENSEKLKGQMVFWKSVKAIRCPFGHFGLSRSLPRHSGKFAFPRDGTRSTRELPDGSGSHGWVFPCRLVSAVVGKWPQVESASEPWLVATAKNRRKRGRFARRLPWCNKAGKRRQHNQSQTSIVSMRVVVAQPRTYGLFNGQGMSMMSCCHSR